MSFVDNFLMMCEEHGEVPSHVLIKVGLSKSFLSRLKEHPDRSPNCDSVLRIARYFGCTLDDLLYDGPVNGRTKTAMKIQFLVDKLSEDEQEYLLKFIQFNWGKRK